MLGDTFPHIMRHKIIIGTAGVVSLVALTTVIAVTMSSTALQGKLVQTKPKPKACEKDINCIAGPIGTCDAKTCMQQRNTGLCLPGNLCAIETKPCPNIMECEQKFRPCQTGDAPACGGYCEPNTGEACVSVRVDNDHSVCTCRTLLDRIELQKKGLLD